MAKYVKPKILEIDPYLAPFEDDLNLRIKLFKDKKKQLAGRKKLADFANAHHYFGFHRTASGWVYREWAPAAQEMYLTGDFNNWDARSHQMTPKDNGVFEIKLRGKNALQAGQKVQAGRWADIRLTSGFSMSLDPCVSCSPLPSFIEGPSL